MDRKHAYLVGKGRSLDTLDKGAFKDPDAEVWCVNHAVLKVSALGLPNKLVCVQTDPPDPVFLPPDNAEWACSERVLVPTGRQCTRFSEEDVAGFEHIGTLPCAMELLRRRGFASVTMLACDSYFGDDSYSDGHVLRYSRYYNLHARKTAQQAGMTLEWVDRNGAPHRDDFRYRRAVVAVACGPSHVSNAMGMCRSFMKANPGWECSQYFDGKVASLLSPQCRSWRPADQCELGRFAAMARELERFDQVVYCDSDVRWYAPMPELPVAPLWLFPHVLTGRGMGDRSFRQYEDGVMNIGIMSSWLHHMSYPVLHGVFKYVLPRASSMRQYGLLWTQKLASCLPEMGMGVRVCSDPGMDVAGWNMCERTIERDADGVLKVRCGDGIVPLRSLHFSRCTLEKLENASPLVRGLVDEYRRDH